MKPESPIPQEARDAADMLLAAVGPMGLVDPALEVCARAGAAMALIADNTNRRLRNLDLQEELKSAYYFKAIGGGLGMTIKFVPEDHRPTVAAALFFYMLDYLGYRTGHGGEEFLDSFTDILLETAQAMAAPERVR